MCPLMNFDDILYNVIIHRKFQQNKLMCKKDFSYCPANTVSLFPDSHSFLVRCRIIFNLNKKNCCHLKNNSKVVNLIRCLGLYG